MFRAESVWWLMPMDWHLCGNEDFNSSCKHGSVPHLQFANFIHDWDGVIPVLLLRSLQGFVHMMTSSNGNIFLCHWLCVREFTGHRWIPQKCQWRGALMFSLICVWINGWVKNGDAVDLRRHRVHYDVTVIGCSSRHTCRVMCDVLYRLGRK